MELAIKLISKDFSARVAFDQSPERREIKKHADNRKKKKTHTEETSRAKALL